MEDLLFGLKSLTVQNIIMFAIGGLLIYLAIEKEYEPMLLLPIGFGAILANIPFSSAIGDEGFLTILFKSGILTELFPILIFIAVGAMIDFKPLLKQPFMLFFGAAAQFGIFFTMSLAALFGFSLKEAASIGIIGAADGPTSIYVATKFAKHLLAPISVAAYSYMALVPIIQPPIIKLLTTPSERRIKMKPKFDVSISRKVEILFPIVVTIIAGVIAPISVALVGSLMFGNLVRVSGVLDRLSKAAQNELANIVTLLLGITIGSTMTAEQFLNPKTLLILAMGLVAFMFDTAGGVIFAKILNLFLKEKINPMIGAAGISAFPMSARVIQKIAQKEDPSNFILMQAVGANVAGQIGSIIAGSLILLLVK
ncbi:sodium ion-translocating decarboxylase subunit beta [Thermovenabulum gondwanense]|uniref:Glutaconyl-CoA decarboxylase subunit beta n=1 Tax=Thermovenabulum gondwanense TaxID=520767 RepID=A0A162M704_9FIRM|nr:sodium ion-translocating decarboxylase subunit beta [Thermovenabulum gondwanense]KYO64353.1 Glutaconyl-CoA decarboxylase subunit beta [Thermovenabulum gondwanense]